MTIGEKIREARLAAGLTQKQLGDMVGIADSAIRKYESGKIRPKTATLKRIASAIGCNISDLDEDFAVAFWASRESDHEVQQEIFHAFSSAKEKIDEYETLKCNFSQWVDSLDNPDKVNVFSVVSSLQNLNSDGKSVASDRIQELTEIPRYRRTAPEDAMTPPAGESDGKETTEE